MADTPDLSKIVGIIMEHPELVGQISSLLSGGDAPSKLGQEVEVSTETKEASVPPKPPTPSGKRSDRARLLGAMKPYLSENRARAVDTMITVTEILESMKGGG